MTEAISNYSNAIKYDPHNYIAYFKRAKIYEIRGETRMAMDDYLSTTKLNPKFYDAWFCHGMNYYNNKSVPVFLYPYYMNV
jgi:Tfp pilus assembly protein PilF